MNSGYLNPSANFPKEFKREKSSLENSYNFSNNKSIKSVSPEPIKTPSLTPKRLKVPSEKLEQDRLRNLTGEYNLNKIEPQKLENSIRLENKTPDDYYRERFDDLRKERERIDEAFGPKTDFSISNFENNYDKMNKEEQEMLTHKMQMTFNKLGYRDKDGFSLKTDGIYGNKTKGVYERYIKDNQDDYKEALERKNNTSKDVMTDEEIFKKYAEENILKDENGNPLLLATTDKNISQFISRNSVTVASNKNNKSITTPVEEKEPVFKMPDNNLAQWLTLEGKKPKHRRLYFDEVNKCINGQGVNGKVKDLKYGIKPISYNGCELIAIYNGMLLKNNQQDFKDIIKTAEETDGVLWLNGIWGSKPSQLGKLLEHYNQKYQKIENEDYNKYLKDGGVYIISFWNSDAIWDGIHTVAFRCDDEKNIIVYNNTNDDLYPYIYKATEEKTGLDLLLEENGKEIVMYELK